eukprot:gene4372-4190_t
MRFTKEKYRITLEALESLECCFDQRRNMHERCLEFVIKLRRTSKELVPKELVDDASNKADELRQMIQMVAEGQASIRMRGQGKRHEAEVATLVAEIMRGKKKKLEVEEPGYEAELAAASEAMLFEEEAEYEAAEAAAAAEKEEEAAEEAAALAAAAEKEEAAETMAASLLREEEEERQRAVTPVRTAKAAKAAAKRK